MRAKVKTSFPGVEDGKVYPREIAVGEIVSGSLATQAVAGGFADELDEKAEARLRADAERKAKEADLKAATKRLDDLRGVAAGARIDLGEAKTEAEILDALKKAGVAVPA